MVILGSRESPLHPPIKPFGVTVVLIINVFCLILIFAVAYGCLPAEVRVVIHENCLNSSGKLKPRYVAREVWSVTEFYAQTLFAALLLACLGIAAIMMVDSYVNLGIIESAILQFDWDIETWRRNLTSAPGNVKEDFTNLHLAQGGTRQSAHDLMVVLWGMVPIACAVCFVAVLTTLRLLSKGYNNALRQLVREEDGRSLRRIKSRYLRSTEEFQQRRLAKQDAHRTWTDR